VAPFQSISAFCIRSDVFRGFSSAESCAEVLFLDTLMLKTLYGLAEVHKKQNRLDKVGHKDGLRKLLKFYKDDLGVLRY